MALVSGGFELVVSLIDNGGNVSNKVYNLDSADAAAAASDAGTVLTALQGVTQAVVKSYRVSQVFVEDNLVLPAGMVQVENIAEIVMQLTSSPLKKVAHAIPAPNPAIFVGTQGPSANIVDTDNTALVDYASIWLVSGPATISDGEKIELPILSGKRIHRASRRG